VLAGRDLEKGGTWMGITRTGRFAALTNFRDPRARKENAPSRGLLVSGFLLGDKAPQSYLAGIVREQYEGFNLVAGDGDGLWYLSSHSAQPAQLALGAYGISNHVMDTPWPKLTRAKARFSALLAQPKIDMEPLFDMLADRHTPDDQELPDTGVGIEWERRLGSVFIASAEYGTRCSTVLALRSDGMLSFEERRFGNEGVPEGSTRFNAQLNIAV
jgi:uncharacterized protein with NRDE domain